MKSLSILIFLSLFFVFIGKQGKETTPSSKEKEKILLSNSGDENLDQSPLTSIKREALTKGSFNLEQSIKTLIEVKKLFFEGAISKGQVLTFYENCSLNIRFSNFARSSCLGNLLSIKQISIEDLPPKTYSSKIILLAQKSLQFELSTQDNL